MATLAALIEELSSSPAATTRLAAAELGLLEQRATGLTTAELRLAAGAELALKPGAEMLLRSPAADLVLEAGSALVLEKGSVLTVGEPSKEYGLLAQPLNTTRLTGLGLPFEPRATLASIVAEQYERPMREFALSLDHSIQLTQTAARQFIESVSLPVREVANQLTVTMQRQQQMLAEQISVSRLAGLSDALLSPIELAAIADMGQPSRVAKQALEQFYAYERRHDLEQQMFAQYLAAEGALLSGLPDVDQMADVLRARRAPAVQVTRAGALIEIEPRTWPPPQRPGSEPPPQSGNFGIPPAQPGQPAGWQALLADALRAGLAQPDEVIRLVAQVAKLPPVAEMQAEVSELEALWAAWQKVKKRQTAESFAARHGLSRATLYRRWERLRELRLELRLLRAWL